MSIKVGDKIPSVTLTQMTADGPKPISTDDVFAGKKVLLFAVPGAFTPLCSGQHLPGYVKLADQIKAKGVDSIVCVSVNDAFVMGAWGKDQQVGDKVLVLADGNADCARAMGLDRDATGMGIGIRSQRYALIADNGVVKHLGVEEGRTFEASKAETVLAAL